MSEDTEPTDIPTKRGAGIQALASRRAASVPPVDFAEADPLPEPHQAKSTPPPQPPPPVTELSDHVRDRKSPAKRSQPKKSKKLIGRQKGGLRHITVRIPLELRQRLDQECEQLGQSLGEVAMDVVRAHHQELRDEVIPPADDGFAAPRRKRQRSRDGTKQQTGLFITNEEAEALQKLSDDVMKSTSLVIEECLRRAWNEGTR